MIFFQYRTIHTRLIIIPFCIPLRYNLHQITVSLIIFCQKHQMVITVISTGLFSVKPGTRCHINLTAQNRIDPFRSGCTIKINHTKHHTMISDRCTVHAQLFYAAHVFFNLIRTIQQTVLCVDMQMCKIQIQTSFRKLKYEKRPM